jgi:hypothetical protein
MIIPHFHKCWHYGKHAYEMCLCLRAPGIHADVQAKLHKCILKPPCVVSNFDRLNDGETALELNRHMCLDMPLGPYKYAEGNNS